jgi:hypothetical protein
MNKNELVQDLIKVIKNGPTGVQDIMFVTEDAYNIYVDQFFKQS